jgi:pimeloyl-ACP methyl ester carboxylesterase
VLGVAAIERANPPRGRFVEVEGGRLHVVELGPPDAPPVVLLHGAAGNLGDIRLALGARLAARHRVILIDRPGHGWSDRPGGSADASPARQAALIRQALDAIGVRRAVMVGHSWSGAVATAFALDHPDGVAALVLLAPVTHPWPGDVHWLDHLITTPLVGRLFVHTLAYPVGQLLLGGGIANAFAPQEPPPGYRARAGAEMILRPAELTANAEDVVQLKTFVTAQVPRYADLKMPTVIVFGNADEIVSPGIHARSIAAVLPRGRLIELPGIGHMVHFAAAARVVEVIEELAAEMQAGR